MQQENNQTAATVTLRVPREDALRVMHLLRAGLLTPEQCSAEDLLSAAGMMRRLSDAAERLPKEIIFAMVRKYEPSGILQNMEPLNYVSLSADLDIALMVASTLLDGVLPESDALIHTEPQHAVERLSETNADASAQEKSTTTHLQEENAPKAKETPKAKKTPKAKETPKAQVEQTTEEPSLDTLRRTVKDATAFVPNARIAMLIKLFAPKPLLPEVPEDKRADLITLLRAATEYHRAASAQVPDAAFAAWMQEQQGRLERTQGTASTATASEAQSESLSLDTLRASVKEAMSVMDNKRIAQMIKLYAPEPQLPKVPEDKRAPLNALLHMAIYYYRASQVAIPDETWYEWVIECKNEIDKQ